MIQLNFDILPSTSCKLISKLYVIFVLIIINIILSEIIYTAILHLLGCTVNFKSHSSCLKVKHQVQLSKICYRISVIQTLVNIFN